MSDALAILGGTFDPPHIGHLVLAECARQQFGAGRVVFMPAGDQWRKREAAAMTGSREPSAAEHRLEMTRLAVVGNEAFSLDEREIHRGGPTYTVDTLEELRLELGPAQELILILGSDAIEDMHAWRTPDRLRELARVVVAPKWDARPPVAVRAEDLVEMPRLPISSTMIRERVAAGRPIRYLVPDAVERYILEQGLYRGG